MKKIISILLSFVLAFGIAAPTINAQAASAKTKKKAIKAYKEWLDGTDFRGFRLYDVDKDGIKELLVTHDGYGNNVFSVYVYTYKNGKVVDCINNDYQPDYSALGFTYNKSTKRMYGSRGGGGSIENWYYTLTKSKKLKKVYLKAIENGYNTKTGKITYKYYYKGKRITKKKYVSIYKSWKKNAKPLKFYKLSSKNIKKYVK